MNVPRILWYYLLTKYARNFRSRDALVSWQNKQVQNFLQEILPKSPFYRKYYHGLDITDWQNFPTIDKSVMMAEFDELNTVGIKKAEALQIAIASEKSRNFASTLRGFTIGMSSGTSGNRGLFIVSQKEQQAWAGAILAKALPQSILKPQRVAFFLRANSNLYETVKRQRIQFEYFDLFDSIENHIERLNKYLPTILVAPPSMLRFLASAQKMGYLNVAPQKIISVAEVLDPLDELYIKTAYPQIIHQIYQCTEGFLAHTCDYGTLHLNEDILVIQKEYIDEQAGRFMPIITDFNRRTQPIIRYCLNDILTERKTQCPCGSIYTAIENIEGRCDDIFYLSHKYEQKLIPIFPDFIRRAIMIASSEIQEYIVVQKKTSTIAVYLKVAPNLQNQIEVLVRNSLQELFTKLNCRIPEINYQEYPVRTEHHQKLRRVRREFNI